MVQSDWLRAFSKISLEPDFSKTCSFRQKMANILLNKYREFQKILMTSFQEKYKKYHFLTKFWHFFHFFPRTRFSLKNRAPSFQPLLKANFLQKIRKNRQTHRLTDRQTDRRTDRRRQIHRTRRVQKWGKCVTPKGSPKKWSPYHWIFLTPTKSRGCFFEKILSYSIDQT